MKKRRLWIVSPFFLIFIVAMVVMTVLSYNPQYLSPFFINLGITLIAMGIVIISLTKHISYIKWLLSEVIDNLRGNIPLNELNGVSVPAVIVGTRGEILIYNELFKKNICEDKDVISNSISDYLGNKTLKEVSSPKGSNIILGNRNFTVISLNCESASTLFFIDNTNYKRIEQEYKDSRPCVMMIGFDNKDELENQATEGDASQIIVMVEKSLQKWAASSSAIYKKLYTGRYMIVLEDRFVREIEKEKFPILEEIRKIKIDERRSASISIGIGKGGNSFQECELWARQALDMSLGRGGDQAAVKDKGSYTFFGGVSTGVEKRDKVRARLIANTLTEHINKSEKVFIMGHGFSDLDCVGAAIGMWSAVTKGLKKRGHIVINRSQSLAKALISSFDNIDGNDDMFISPDEALALADEKSLLIVVDTHSPTFVESPKLLEICSKRVVVIDHHRMMVNHINNALIFFHESYASSASEMTAELVQYIGDDTISQLEAEALLAGIMLDTKNFVLKTGVRTFEAAAYLRRKGADTVEVKRLFSNSIDTYKVKCQLISEAEIFNFCAIAVADEALPDIRIASAQAADELLGIEGVKASFVMYPTGETINISARSLGDVNVQLIMEALGGGGHQTMAGAQVEATLAEVREKLVEKISDLEIDTKNK